MPVTAPVPDPVRTSTTSHAKNISGQLNWLRAGVLGANAGIVHTVSVVIALAVTGWLAGRTPRCGPARSMLWRKS